MIPPSLSLLIYGALTDTSIGKLFIAGILPGLMMAALFMIVVFWSARRDPTSHRRAGSKVLGAEALFGVAKNLAAADHDHRGARQPVRRHRHAD